MIGCAGKHAKISDLAFSQVQPPDVPDAHTHIVPWAPIQYPPTIYNPGCECSSSGSFIGQNLLFRGVYRGIALGNITENTCFWFVGRTVLRDIYGTFFETGIELTALSDVAVVDHIHFWPVYFAAEGNENVFRYIQSNATGLALHRSDNPQFSNLFINSMSCGLHFRSTHNISGWDFVNNCQMTNVGLDGIVTGILVDEGVLSDCVISNIYHQSPGDFRARGVNGSCVKVANPSSGDCWYPAAKFMDIQGAFSGTMVNIKLANYRGPAISLAGAQVTPPLYTSLK